MATADETSVKTLGGKGSVLSSAIVHSIASNLSKVKIDSSIIEKLSHSKRSFSLSRPKELPSNPIFLTLEQSRASLAVLLNKLVVSDLAIRSNLPFLIEKTLNVGFDDESLYFGSVLDFFYSIRCSFGATVEEDGAMENSLAALIGICALLDCSSSVLVTIADVVAALSCEALKADLAVFDLPVSGEGFSIKDETDVAGDMKVLLFGSKLVGRVDSELIPEIDLTLLSEIPAVHGCFRQVSRLVHSCVRVELNSTIKIRKSGVGSSSGKGKTLVSTVLPLAMSLKSVGESSLGRATMIIGSIDDGAMRAQVVDLFEKNCSGFDDLKNAIQSILVKAALETDYVIVLREIYDLLIKLRVILSWEAALAMFVLDVNDSCEKTQVMSNGGDKNVEKKNEKKKNKRALGKGTTIIREVIKERFRSKCGTSGGIVMELVEWARELCLFFDPKDVENESLLVKVKEILESNEVRRLPKIPKGTRDFGKDQMAIRERAFSIIVGVFKRHGAVSLDTPVFELRETLMGKYGEDSKLIYDLADQGGEICSLRYDLTVPFARYLAMNSISALKRYQIAKVYRRDNPSKGRYREFYQCDFDVAGQYEPMESDFEVIKVLTELLNELNIGDFEIKLNHRKLLDGMLEICGVSPEKFRTVCSSIDKLDKQSFEQIKKELVEEKGLNVETAEKIGSFVKKRGPPLELLSELKQEGSQFLENDGSILALKDLEILFKALEKSNSIDKVVLDLSLARGLDYYTGVIFEAVFKGATQVGSIAAGGRYDNLVGMFSGKQVPAVGVSLGIERVFTIMEQLEKDRNQAIRATETEVLVVVLGKDLVLAAELVSELWNAKVKAEFSVNKKVTKEIQRAIQSGIPFLVIVGEWEQENGVVKLKDIEAKEEQVVPRATFVKLLQDKLNSYSKAPSNFV